MDHSSCTERLNYGTVMSVEDWIYFYRHLCHQSRIGTGRLASIQLDYLLQPESVTSTEYFLFDLRLPCWLHKAGTTAPNNDTTLWLRVRMCDTESRLWAPFHLPVAIVNRPYITCQAMAMAKQVLQFWSKQVSIYQTGRRPIHALARPVPDLTRHACV